MDKKSTESQSTTATAAGVSAATATMGKQRGRQQEVVGVVVSDKMEKTISVKIFRRVRHPKYGKYMKQTSVFKAHDEKNDAKRGDKVRIQMTRPLSKTKRWRLMEIVEKADQELEGVQV